jgi:hypothetical protein
MYECESSLYTFREDRMSQVFKNKELVKNV